VGRLIRLLGTRYSRLKPRHYTIVFCTCDVIALVIQSIGGGMASSANTNSGAATGGHIALGGIVFQFAAVVVYMLLTIEFLVRFALKKPFSGREDTLNGARMTVLDSKTKQMILGVGFSSLAMFIRGIYRTIELADGWSGRIISVERYFIALDGSMILFSMIALNVFHPCRLLGNEAEIQEKKNNSVSDV